VDKTQPIGLSRFKDAYKAALSILPSANVLNILSKARDSRHMEFVINLFRTDVKIEFQFDDDHHNFLYLNGIIDKETVMEEEGRNYYVRFSSPFIQNKLFQSFSRKIFNQMEGLIDPLTDIEAVIGNTFIDIKTVLVWYQTYLQSNKEWLLKDVPRRADLQVYEAVFHFNIYMYLFKLLTPKGALVVPEFPTGNGKIDLIIRYGGAVYGLELKTFKDRSYYKTALTQTARYGKQLNVSEITLVFFIHKIDDANRQKLETPYTDKESKVCVKPMFIETGE
jgi:hypothetical protein